jgi:carboxymethylenebutenolidase
MVQQSLAEGGSMPVQAEWIRFEGYSGYLARPAGVAEPLPGVVVIQEIWGVDEHIEDVARRLAAAGYAALAPDLFAGNGARPEPLARERVAEVKAFMARLAGGGWDPAVWSAGLADLPADQRDRMDASRGALMGSLGNLDRYLPALRASARHLRQAEPGQKVGCVGFCMGGGLSALLACEEPELAASAIFYGSAPPLERVPRIACPVLGFYGGLDAKVNAGLPAFSAAMAAAGKSFTAHTYEGAAHAFFNDTRGVYHVGAARDSFARLLEFYRTHLVP